MKEKIAKLVVKNAEGELIHILPEVKGDNYISATSDAPVSGRAISAWGTRIQKSVEHSLDGVCVYKGSKTNLAALQSVSSPSSGDMWSLSSTKEVYIYDGTTWLPIGSTVDSAYTLTGTEIDLSLSSVFIKTVEANTSFTIVNAPSGMATSFKLVLINGGAYTISWPNSVTWSGGSEPVLQTNGTDLLTFNTWDGGTTWRATPEAVAGLSGKEVAILSAEPTAANTDDLDNEALVFWSEGTTIGQAAGSPVLLSGNQTIEGQKKFLGGLYGGAYTMGTAEWAIDLTKATCFTKTVTSSGTFSFTNVPEATACCITLILVNGGNYTVRWPASVKWSENTTPTLTQNGTDVFTFVTCTGGNVWYGTTTCIGVTA